MPYRALDTYLSENTLDTAEDEDDKEQIRLVTEVCERISETYIEDCRKFVKESINNNSKTK